MPGRSGALRAGVRDRCNTRPAHSRVSRQRTGGAGPPRAGDQGDVAYLAADRDGGPGDGLALADRVPERAGSHRDGYRDAGQAVTPTPVAATAAGPAVRALDTPP